MKKVMCLLCLFLLGLSLIGCGDTEIPGTATEGVLVVGMECDYAPFNWTEWNIHIRLIQIAELVRRFLRKAVRFLQALILKMQPSDLLFAQKELQFSRRFLRVKEIFLKLQL